MVLLDNEVSLGPRSAKQSMILQNDSDILIAGGAAGCVDGDTEFLSQSGWKKISEYTDSDLVMQYDVDSGIGSLVRPDDYICKPSDGFYYLKTERGLDQMLSKEHRILYETSKGGKLFKSAKDFFSQHERSSLGSKSKILTTYSFLGKDLDIPENVLRLYVALKADGSIATESTMRYVVRLKKSRKIERFRHLLLEAGWDYKEYKNEGTGFSVFTLYADQCSKDLYDYMFCSKKDAEIIIDELKYWDSYFLTPGNRIPKYFSTKKSDADAVQYFFNICGYKASIGKDIRDGRNTCFNVTATTQTKLTLQRKPCNKIEIPFVPPSDGDMKYCFSVPSGALVFRRNDNVFITGNSGKSYLLLLMMLKYIDCPYWRGVIFRRTTTELETGGGLFDEAVGLYSSLPVEFRPKINSQKLLFTFPSGARLKLSHMQHHPQDTIKQHGSQWSLIAFDELTTFLEDQFTYMSSRLRSKSKYKGRIVCTCNPHPESFVLKYIRDHLDDDGFPIAAKDGVERFIIRRGDEIYFKPTEKELIKDFGAAAKPLSFTFISANIHDNPVLIADRPEYLAHLESLKEVDKARLLYGK